MISSAVPGFIVLPFADSGDKTAIPVTTATPGRASLTTGFPPLNRTPIASGGIPPDGTDMNGILYEVSAWSRWTGAGGPVAYDSTFSTAIGGYPRGSVVASSSFFGRYFSLINNNTADPDTTGTGWMNMMPVVTSITATGSLTIRQQGMVSVDATAGNITLTLPNANFAYGLPISFTLVRADTTANTVTISRVGSNTIEGLTAIPLAVGGRITLTGNGVDTWRMTAAVSQGGLQSITSSGNFTVPAGVFRLKRVTVTGGGGGGGGCAVGQGAGGGGAGGTSIIDIAVTPGDVIAVTVGAAGTAGGSGGSPAGGAGGSSSFGAYCSATGGGGGDVTAGGGLGGLGSGGTVNLYGGDGGDGSYLTDTYGGTGGASYWGGGGRGGVSSGGGGLVGRARGSGGGGAYSRGTGPSAGGTGSPGIVVVEW